MTTELVYRDIDGTVINIGEWDYMNSKIDNGVDAEPVDVINNPLPEGATSAIEEITVLPDGGLAVVSGS